MSPTGSPGHRIGGACRGDQTLDRLLRPSGAIGIVNFSERSAVRGGPRRRRAMSTDTERRELVRPDATIAYWVSGPERAPVVLLLHGATLDHRAWDAQVDELTPQYRVVVPDLRGHGESTLEGASGSTTPSTTSRHCWTRSTTGAPVALGGLSLGGNIAQEIVHRDPQPGRCAGRRRLHLQHRIAPPAGRAADHRRATGDGAGRPRAVHAAGGGGHLAARRRAPVRPGRQRGPHDPEVLQILTSLLDQRPAPGAGLPPAGADPAGERRRRPGRRHRHRQPGVGGPRPDGRATW